MVDPSPQKPATILWLKKFSRLFLWVANQASLSTRAHSASPPQPKIESRLPAGCKNKFHQFPAVEALGRERAAVGTRSQPPSWRAEGRRATSPGTSRRVPTAETCTASSSTCLTRATCWTSPRGTLARGRRRRRGGGRGTTALAATTPGTSGSGRGKGTPRRTGSRCPARGGSSRMPSRMR